MTVLTPPGPLRLFVLGGLHAQAGGGSLGPAAKQPRRIGIAALAAIAGEEGLSRDRLLGFFWPEQDEASARNALKQATHALRRDLGAPDLFLDGKSLRLNPAVVQVDLWDFDRACVAGDWRAAVSLYRGPLLDGTPSLGSSELEHWLDMERERTSRRFASAVEAAASAATARGDRETALQSWYKLATIDPLNGRAAEAIARGLAETGDRNAALQHAQAHLERVASELGLPADPNITALMEELAAPSTRLRISPPPVTVHPPAATPVVDPGPASPAPPSVSRHLRRMAIVACGVVLAGGAAALYARNRSEAVQPARIPSIAVLPFDNLGAAEDGYFSDGLTDEVTDRLGAISGLRVISRKSAASYKGSRKTPAQIAAELGVEYLLEGTVRWQKNPNGASRVRITHRLIRASDGTGLWSNSLEEPLGQVFAAQSAIANQVAQSLRVSMLGPERDRVLGQAPTASDEAHDYYLRAKAVLARNAGERDLLIASQLYHNAVQADSNFADAWAGVALTAAELYWSYYDRTPQRLSEAGEAAERAVRLNPESRAARLAMGYYHYYGFLHYDRALQEFQVARRIAPGDGDVLEAIAFVRRRQGQWEEAITNLEQALAADPRAFMKAYVLGETYLKVGRYREAQRRLEQAIAINPTNGQAYSALALLHLTATGDIAKARAAIRQGLQTAGPVSMMRAAMLVGGVVLRIFPAEFETALQGMDASDFDTQPEVFYLGRAMMCERLPGHRGCKALYDSARAILEPKAAARGDLLAYYHALLSIAHAGAGDSEDAVREGREAVDLLPISKDASNGPNIALFLAQAHAMLGQNEAAVRELRIISRAPSLFNERLLAVDPVWSGLRVNGNGVRQ